MSEVLGLNHLPWQINAIEHILQLHQSNRLPHALLVELDSSEDASEFLRYLAAVLVCRNRDGLALCESCESCVLMQAGTYPDFTWIVPEMDEGSKKVIKNIKIEQIRKLIHELGLTARDSRLKIAVIYPAERMNHASANALLKTLEEPAKHVLLLLATHNKGRIPVTIRSRCQSIGIKLPAADQARQWLIQQDFSDEDASSHLDYAGGDPLLALRLREQGYAEIANQFKTSLVDFLRDQVDVDSLSHELIKYDTDLVRRLISTTIKAYSFRSCGLDLSLDLRHKENRTSARGLIQLHLQAQEQLRAGENNLDFKTQLEDVLISLKQILKRRHG